MDQAIDAVNEIASEHLEIVTENPFEVMTKVKKRRGDLLGAYSSEPLGDYFAGPNHVLPTNGTRNSLGPQRGRLYQESPALSPTPGRPEGGLPGYRSICRVRTVDGACKFR